MLHVTQSGQSETFLLNDGKSGSLHRYVNLDTGRIYYIMGKQIAGKPIDPNGTVGRHILSTARQLMNKSHTIESAKLSPRADNVIAVIVFIIFAIIGLRYC